MIYFGIYTILNKMNLLSLILWGCLYAILRKNFKPNLFKGNQLGQYPGTATNYNVKAAYGSVRNKEIIFLVKLNIAVISILIVIQLIFSIYTNIQFSQQEDF